MNAQSLVLAQVIINFSMHSDYLKFKAKSGAIGFLSTFFQVATEYGVATNHGQDPDAAAAEVGSNHCNSFLFKCLNFKVHFIRYESVRI